MIDSQLLILNVYPQEHMWLSSFVSETNKCVCFMELFGTKLAASDATASKNVSTLPYLS